MVDRGSIPRRGVIFLHHDIHALLLRYHHQ
ncbi:unnamed protein product [Debaryomyces tyrocola]|nr:unnamed protein product [Debaryomyces tyrocola]